MDNQTRVEAIEIRNFKAVRHVTIYAQGQSVELTGANEAGKSSVLDAVVSAIAGAKAVQEQPLRRDERKGFASVTLTGGLELRREFSAKSGGKGKLKVIDPQGRRWGQREIDELWSTWIFDPLAFSRLGPTDQAKQLQQFAGEDFCDTLKALDSKIAKAKEERKDLKRDLKLAGKVTIPAQVEPVDVADLSRELQEAEKFNREQDETRDELTQLGRRLEHADSEVKRLSDELEAAKRMFGQLAAEHHSAPRPEPHIDTSAIHQRLTEAGEINAKAQSYKDAKARAGQISAMADRVQRAEDNVEDLVASRAELATKAELPVPGLTWTEDGVFLDGLPFEQMASSKQLRVAAKLGMANLPQLRIMYIRDGSLLDQESFTELLQIAKGAGVQLWIETVGKGHDGDHVVVEIVEGEADCGRPF
jgi:DNA repair exonuclease SbcCD ATPase subunit